MSRFVAWALGAILLTPFIATANAAVLVSVSTASQRMTVEVDGRVQYTWPVSTGAGGHHTPNGTYRPQSMARSHFSSRYYNSPMPYSIFFHKGYAIHGTHAINQLGGPASHGCIRLHPQNAATLFEIVQRNGMGGTRIVIH